MRHFCFNHLPGKFELLSILFIIIIGWYNVLGCVEKWVEFIDESGHSGQQPNIKYTNMAEVKALIQEHSDSIARSGEIISDKVLTVKLFSPNVVDLTLVDLPGLIVVC